MLDLQRRRINRLEEATATSELPNPFRLIQDTATASDSLTATASARTDLVWDSAEEWDFSEWSR